MRRSGSPISKLSLVLASAASALAVSAAAADGPQSTDTTLKAAFSGTIVSTYPDGRQGRLWLNSDGTYRAAGRKNDPSSGKWKVKGEKVCLSQSKPVPAPMSFCTPKPAAKEWTAKAVSGERIRVKLVSGGREG